MPIIAGRPHKPASVKAAPLRLLLWMALWCWSAAAAADIALVTHPGNPLRTLDVADARRIFLKQTHEYPDGKRVYVALLSAPAETRQLFEKQVLKMSASQIKTYWAGFIFSGQNRPPREFLSAEDMKQWIAATPGALGYLDVEDVDDTVKVLTTVAATNSH